VSGLNYLAVLVAAVLNMLVGAVWYSQSLFAKSWMELVGFKPDEMAARRQGMGRAMAWMFVGSLVMAYALARVLWYAKITSAGGGAMIGLLAWIGFVAPTHGANYLFEGKPFRLYGINTGYPLVALVLMGALLAVWK
jgi:hypothetical protein